MNNPDYFVPEREKQKFIAFTLKDYLHEYPDVVGFAFVRGRGK
jgi:hypothetical protein